MLLQYFCRTQLQLIKRVFILAVQHYFRKREHLVLVLAILITLFLQRTFTAFNESFVYASLSSLNPLRSDFNGDGVVNIIDLSIIALAWNAYPEHPKWNSTFDFNDDQIINILDLVLFLKDYQKSWLCYDFHESLDFSVWRIIDGTWSTLGGMLEGSSRYEGLIYAEDVVWKDCTLSGKVKITVDSVKPEVAFCFNVVDSKNFYWAGLGCWGHRVSISKMVNGVPEELAYEGEETEIVKDVWYTVSIEVSGNALNFYVNDVLELTVKDSTFSSGKIGVRIYNSHALVDYITVSGTKISNLTFHEVLYAEGTKLRAPSGEEVILVGTQYDYNAMTHEEHAPIGGWFQLDDVQRIKAHGGNVLGLHLMSIQFMMPEAGVINETWFVQRLDKYVSWCEQTGIYCIIDLANFDNPWWWPKWLIINETDQYEASIHFWDIDYQPQEQNRQYVIQILKFIANRYKNNKYVLFGLFNEPFAGNRFVTTSNAKHLSISYARLVERFIDAIRSTGAKQLIFVDKPYCWFKTDHFEPVNRDNIVWEDHLYIGPHRDLDQWKATINEYVQRYVYEFKKPFYLGEYGFIDYSYQAHINNRFPNWKNVLAEQVAFLKSIPVCGYSWHEYPWLDGEWYDYCYSTYKNFDSFTPEESEYILNTIFG